MRSRQLEPDTLLVGPTYVSPMSNRTFMVLKSHLHPELHAELVLESWGYRTTRLGILLITAAGQQVLKVDTSDDCNKACEVILAFFKNQGFSNEAPVTPEPFLGEEIQYRQGEALTPPAPSAAEEQLEYVVPRASYRIEDYALIYTVQVGNNRTTTEELRYTPFYDAALLRDFERKATPEVFLIFITKALNQRGSEAYARQIFEHILGNTVMDN